MKTVWGRIVRYFEEGSANKFIKISLFLFAIYVGCLIVLLLSVREPILHATFSWCESLWLGASPLNSYCFGAIEKMTWGLMTIAGIGYVFATATGIIAMYKAIKTHHKWWAVITIFAVIQASPLFLGPFTA